ncbi:unnamed protein product [Scytosiphon promiscuus]
MVLPASVWPILAGGLLLRLGQYGGVGAITVELNEVLPRSVVYINEEFSRLGDYWIESAYGGVDPIDADCPLAGKCIGLLTRDGSLGLQSQYGCTKPSGDDLDDSVASRTCGITYGLADGGSVTIAAVKVALHPFYVQTLSVSVNGDPVVSSWEADVLREGELQEIPGLEGLEASYIELEGIMEPGEYLGILEVEIYVVVDEVEATGVSASTRTSITATATTDEASVMNTLDGDASDGSSWTCLSGEVCEITYDLQAVESLEQLRIAFSGETDAVGGEVNVMTAGESGVFSPVVRAAAIEADPTGRPLGSDGLQTFGAVRALARYVKIEVVVPTSGSGKVVISEMEFRVGEDAPARPVDEKAWLKPTGKLPSGNPSSSGDPYYDIREPEDGGCDSPIHFEGCHIFYIKACLGALADDNMDSRFTCGPLSTGESSDWDCAVNFRLNQFRYVRQIQMAFHTEEGEHNEFSIEAYTAVGEWVTVVPSVITSGDSTDFQTFDAIVHTNELRLVPKFRTVTQWFSVKELVILERRKNDFIAGTVPVGATRLVEVSAEYDDDEFKVEADIPTRFEFDLLTEGDLLRIYTPDCTMTAVRMRFPADRQFVFSIVYSLGADFGWEDATEEFTSAGGEKQWETFTLSSPVEMDYSFEIVAISGPSFDNVPDYPTLRVVDFQVVGELIETPGLINVVSTTLEEWWVQPDYIGDGVSEQHVINAAICEGKGATYDGVDCVGELNDAEITINLQYGEYYVDGPIFVKSGVTLDGHWYDDSEWCELVLYGDDDGVTGEEAIIVLDGVTGARLENLAFRRKVEPTGDIVPGTLGNLLVDIRNSEDIELDTLGLFDARIGAARFTDSRNMSGVHFESGEYEAGNYMEFTRVEDVYFRAMPYMAGMLFDSCSDIVLEGVDDFQIPTARLLPPVEGTSQTASVLITGDTSGIVLQNCEVGPGAEPRILVESSEPLVLDNVIEYEDAVSGDCIVEVPEGTGEDFIVQVKTNPNSGSSTDDTINQLLVKSGNCWVLE